MSGMEHGADPADRLRAFSSFGTMQGGHVAVMTLMKRWDLLTLKALPEGIEHGWTDRYAVLWDRLTRIALGTPRDIQHASRMELWRMAQSLVSGIAKLDARCDHYPDGWQAIVALVRTGVSESPTATKAAPRKVPASSGRMQVLTTLDYVASELGWGEDKVLRAARKTRAKLGAKDVAALMAVYSGEMEHRAGSGPPEILYDEPMETRDDDERQQ